MNSGYGGGEYSYHGVSHGFHGSPGSDDSNSGHGEGSSVGQDILQNFPYLRHTFGQQAGFPPQAVSIAAASQQSGFPQDISIAAANQEAGFPQAVSIAAANQQAGFPQAVSTAVSQHDTLNTYRSQYQESLMQVQSSNTGSGQFPVFLVTQQQQPMTQGRLPSFSSIPEVQSQLSRAFRARTTQTAVLQSAGNQPSMKSSVSSYPAVQSLTSGAGGQLIPAMSSSHFIGASTDSVYQPHIKKELDLPLQTQDVTCGLSSDRQEASLCSPVIASNKPVQLASLCSPAIASTKPVQLASLCSPVIASTKPVQLASLCSPVIASTKPVVVASQSAAVVFESLLEASQVVSQTIPSSASNISNLPAECSSQVVVTVNHDQSVEIQKDNTENKSERRESARDSSNKTDWSLHAPRRCRVKFYLKGRLHKGAKRHPKQILSEVIDNEEILFDNIVLSYPSSASKTEEHEPAELSKASDTGEGTRTRYVEPSLAEIRAGAMRINDGSADAEEDVNDEDFDSKTDDYNADETFANNSINLSSNDGNASETWYSAAMKQYAEMAKDGEFEEEIPVVKKGGRSDPENPFAMTSPSFSESAAKALMCTTVTSTATIVMISIMSIGSREKLIPKIVNSKAAEGGIVSIVNPVTKKKDDEEMKDKSTDTECDLKIEATPIMSRLRREKKENKTDKTDDGDTEIDRLDINIKIDDEQCVSHGEHKRWQCKICPKSYTTKHNLVAHILDHSGIKPHLCLMCGKYFKQLSHLNTHMLTHDNVKPHVCPVCNKGFTQISHLKRHETVHLDSKPYICDICNRGFAFPSELRLHKDKHLPGKERCLECEQEFASQKELREHMLQDKHCNNLACKHCERVFKFPSQLKDHMMSHAGSRPFICSECGMDFMKDHHLKAHQFTHTGLRPFSCPHCHRAFNQKANMMRHMLIHNAQRAYQCEVCAKTFTQPQTLKAHMVVHADKKPYSCKFCGKQFGRLHNLQGHLHIHTDSKPYVCSICQSAFTLKGNLNRHKKVKHGLNESTENMEEDAVNFLSSMSGRVNDNMTDTDPEYDPDSRDDTTSLDARSAKKGRKSVPRKHVSRKTAGDQDSETGNDVDNNSDTEENSNFISYSDEERENEERMKVVQSKYFEPEDSENISRPEDSENISRSRRKKETCSRVENEEEVEETNDADVEEDEYGPEAELKEEVEKDENENGIDRQTKGRKGDPEPERRSTRKRKKKEIKDLGVDDDGVDRKRPKSSRKGAHLDSIIASKFKNSSPT